MTRTIVSLKLRGETHPLGIRTWFMGVLNITPDSFYDGGRFLDPGRAVARGLELAAQGADILDVGGESSRPGSEPVPAEEEMRRVVPVLTGLRRQTSAFLSIDTTKSIVARAAMDAGADIINDISAMRFDSDIPPLAARRDVAVVLMHMLGVPRTMQQAPAYQNTVAEVKGFLFKRLAAAVQAGLNRDRIIIDPGIGFGKRLKDNLVLLNHLPDLEDLGCPILVGPSRKSFIGKILDLPPEDRLEGTLAASVLSVARGAHILRVHDVQAVRRAVRVAEAILGEEKATGDLEEPNRYVC
jgi:dihydropteroate synthase